MKRSGGQISQTRRDILRAFFVLEKETGRTAFTTAEVFQRASHVNRSTLNVHCLTRMNKGDSHLDGTNELETVGRAGRRFLVSLSSFGRQQIKDLGLDHP